MQRVAVIQWNATCHWEVVAPAIAWLTKSIQQRPLHFQVFAIEEPGFEAYLRHVALQIGVHLGVTSRKAAPSIAEKVLNDIIRRHQTLCFVTHHFCQQPDFLDKYFARLGRRFVSIRHYQRETTKNIVGMAPFCQHRIDPCVLPAVERKSAGPVVVCVQGNLTCKRRDFAKIAGWLSRTRASDFVVVLLGRGNAVPADLRRDRRVLAVTNLDFENFHRCFASIDAIATLLSEDKQPRYYSRTMTSTASYALTYDLPTLTDDKLQAIYDFPNFVSEQEPDPIQALCEAARAKAEVRKRFRSLGIGTRLDAKTWRDCILEPCPFPGGDTPIDLAIREAKLDPE